MHNIIYSHSNSSGTKSHRDVIYNNNIINNNTNNNDAQLASEAGYVATSTVSKYNAGQRHRSEKSAQSDENIDITAQALFEAQNESGDAFQVDSVFYAQYNSQSNAFESDYALRWRDSSDNDGIKEVKYKLPDPGNEILTKKALNAYQKNMHG